MIDWSIQTSFWDFCVITRFAPKSKHILPATCVLPCRSLIGELPVTSFGGGTPSVTFFSLEIQPTKGQVSTENNERWDRFYMLSRIAILDGGNSTILYFHPENWERFPFLLIFFRWVGSTTNQYFSFQLQTTAGHLSIRDCEAAAG